MNENMQKRKLILQIAKIYKFSFFEVRLPSS